MKRNFDFLKDKKDFKSFANACIEAEKSLVISPATTAILSRRALELAVKWVYSFDKDLTIPYRDNLSSLVHENSFKYLISSEMFNLLKYIIQVDKYIILEKK